MAKKTALKEKEVKKDVVKTYEIFLKDLTENTDGLEHTLECCFPGKIVVLDIGNNYELRELVNFKNKDGMIYVMRCAGEVRIAFIDTEGYYLITPVGNYRKEYDWHVMDTDDFRIVVEETNLWEEAFCAELSWRILWEREQEEKVRAKSNRDDTLGEFLKRYFG